MSASLFAEPEWYSLHLVPNVTVVEQEHGTEAGRHEHNLRSFERARREKEPVIAEHAGFSDLFVPIGDGRRVWATLVTGPYAKARPTAGDPSSAGTSLTGTHPRLNNPAFARYVAGDSRDSHRSRVDCWSRFNG